MLAQGSLGALNAELLFSLHPEVSHDLEIGVAGAFVATIQFQIAPDGTNFVAAQVVNINTGATSTDMTAAGVYRLLGLPGVKDAKVKMTARTSGAAAVSVRATRST